VITREELVEVLRQVIREERGLYDNDRMAAHLGISLTRWQRIYREDTGLQEAAGVQLPGGEWRWRPGDVEAYLKRGRQ
jgi:hypothetical protein